VIFFLKKTKKYFFYKFGKAWIRIRIEILGWIWIKECGSETLIIILFIFMQPQRREYRCGVQRSHQAAAACRRSQYPLHRHRWQVNFNPNCSGVRSNLHVLGVRAFLTSIDTVFPFQLITQISKFTVFDVHSSIFYSICVSQTKYFSPHFLDRLIKEWRHCGRELP
jgi:hypothetical protein